MNEAKKPLSVQRDEDRLAHLAPQRSQFAAPDVFGGKKLTANDERVRNVERGRYADFFRRRYGRPITEADYPERLREGEQ